MLVKRIADPKPSLPSWITAGGDRRSVGDAPNVLNTSSTITADITGPQGDAGGMIATSGGRFAGWGFYLLKGKPTFCRDLLEVEWVVGSPEADLMVE